MLETIGILLENIIVIGILALVIRWCNRKTILNDIGWVEHRDGNTYNETTGDKITYGDLLLKPWADIEREHPTIAAPIKARKSEPW